MTIVLLVRHGQSVSNAGLRTVRPHLTELTAIGKRQARLTAAALPEPALIAWSPYRRAHDTARPFIRRWPSVREVEWPVQEFTFLDPTAWDGTTVFERRPAVAAFWKRGDPHYAGSERAESFAQLIARADRVRHDSLASGGGPVVIFTHGLFSKLFLWRCAHPRAKVTAEAMARARAFALAFTFPNCGIVEVHLGPGGATHRPADVSHLPPDLVTESVLSMANR